MEKLFQEISGIKKLQKDSLESDGKINAKLDSIQNSLQSIQVDVSKHSKELSYLDANSRRKNLLIFGLKEDPNEKFSDLEDKILNLIIQKLELPSFSLAELDFIRRLRSKKFPRPILIGLTTQRRKFDLLKNGSKLKEEKIFIREDSPPAVKQKEKELLPQMHEYRKQGKYAVVRAGKLIVRENQKPLDTGKTMANKRALSVSPSTPTPNSKRVANMESDETVYHTDSEEFEPLATPILQTDITTPKND